MELEKYDYFSFARRLDLLAITNSAQIEHHGHSTKTGVNVQFYRNLHSRVTESGGAVAPAFGQAGGGVRVQLLERIPTANFSIGVPLN